MPDPLKKDEVEYFELDATTLVINRTKNAAHLTASRGELGGSTEPIPLTHHDEDGESLEKVLDSLLGEKGFRRIMAKAPKLWKLVRDIDDIYAGGLQDATGELVQEARQAILGDWGTLLMDGENLLRLAMRCLEDAKAVRDFRGHDWNPTHKIQWTVRRGKVSHEDVVELDNFSAIGTNRRKGVAVTHAQHISMCGEFVWLADEKWELHTGRGDPIDITVTLEPLPDGGRRWRSPQ